MVNTLILFIKDYLDFFSFIGSIFSTLGFIVTILIFLKLKRIHSEYLFKITTPELLRKLEERFDNINTYLNDFKRFINDINSEFTVCKANLKSLQKKAPRDIKKSVQRVIKMIDSFLRVSNYNKNADDAYKIYSNIQGLVEECKNIWEDIKWGGRYE